MNKFHKCYFTNKIKRVKYLIFNYVMLYPHLMHELMHVFMNSSTEQWLSTHNRVIWYWFYNSRSLSWGLHFNLNWLRHLYYNQASPHYRNILFDVGLLLFLWFKAYWVTYMHLRRCSWRFVTLNCHLKHSQKQFKVTDNQSWKWFSNWIS